MRLALTIAWRHLTTIRRGSFSTIAGILAILGLAIGLAALLITYAVIDGFERTISEKISSFDGHIQITHFLDTPFSPNQAKIDSLLGPYEDTVNLIPFLQQPLILRKGSRAEGGICMGMGAPDLPPALSALVVPPQSTIRPGTAILGDRLAGLLGAAVGDKIVLMHVDTEGGLANAPRYRQVIVSGVIHSGLLDYDRSIVYLSLQDLQLVAGLDRQISGYILYEKNPELHRQIYARLQAGLPYPLYPLSWKDKHRILYDWMTIQKWPILIIFGLIALVGVVNIMSALMMIILEKIRQIGILKAQGLATHSIRNIFLLEGLMIGFLGSALGGVTAWILITVQHRFNILSIPEDVYFMDRIPVHISWPVTLSILGLGILCSLLSVLWPVKRAMSIKPAPALRYE
ncbi:MAG: ABC transporter permease [FCB group bacterium]|nr:ABC transporter permease [FCB group bacterium]